MFRALASLLVALPLLMPPGMCVCQFGPLGPVTAAASESAARPDGACPAGDRGCCGHRKAAVKRKADGNDRPISSRLPVPGRGEGVPDRPDRPHEPGCPALRAPDHSKLAEQNRASLILAVNRDGVSLAEGVLAGRSFDVPAQIRGQASPPLYLSFCTLLI